MSRFTDFLYARPSFLEGVARVLDVGGGLTEFNKSLTIEEADLRAIAADWGAVGQDLRDAIAVVTKKQAGHSSKDE